MMHNARREAPRPPPRRGGPGRGFATSEGDESPRAPSDRTVSEFMIANERLPGAPVYSSGNAGYSSGNPGYSSGNPGYSSSTPGYSMEPITSRQHQRVDSGSDIYVTTGAYHGVPPPRPHSRAPSEFSRVSYPRSEGTIRSKVSRKGGAVIETVATPSPFCPDTRGVCCLMLLLNLALMLITLGFIVVIQFYEPVYIWILGIVFLVFGFITLIGSFIYCVYVCRDARHPADLSAEDFYWKHRWRTRVGSPEIHYRSEERYPDEDRSGISRLSSRRSDRY